MSVDLTVPIDLNENAQYAEDQNGNQSSLALSDLESNGRVGIATENPIRRLSINGVRNDTDNNEYIGFHEGENDQLKWHINGGTAEPNNGLSFVESGVADFRLFLAPGGNVGIGTGTPQARLDVNGSMKATGLVAAGDLNFQGPSIRLANLTTPPEGVTTADLVVDPATSRIYHQK